MKIWKPKNSIELKELYGKYEKEAIDKIMSFSDEVKKYVVGSGYDDCPPRKGVFINVDRNVTKEALRVLKGVENEYVGIEIKGQARFAI